ncbi:hypothetical protein Tco_1321816 [Tanacetum coccineum]
MFPEELDEVKKYVGGLPDMIQGNVMSTKPKTMEEAIEMANNMMDQKLCTLAERQIENKRKQDNDFKNNQNHQQPNMRQNISRAYTTGPSEKESPGNANASNNQRTTGLIKRERQCSSKGVCGGQCRDNPNSNVITGTFLLNNRYAYILFDIGADRSFLFTAFSSLIDITPTTLDHYYDVELADEKIITINTIIRGCTLNFLNHPFNIDLMPVELGSFDVIIVEVSAAHELQRNFAKWTVKVNAAEEVSTASVIVSTVSYKLVLFHS